MTEPSPLKNRTRNPFLSKDIGIDPCAQDISYSFGLAGFGYDNIFENDRAGFDSYMDEYSPFDMTFSSNTDLCTDTGIQYPQVSFDSIQLPTLGYDVVDMFEAADMLKKQRAVKRFRKSKNVGIACINCKKAHLACDNHRPCERCRHLNKAECVDVVHKQRGRPRIKNRHERTNIIFYPDDLNQL